MCIEPTAFVYYSEFAANHRRAYNGKVNSNASYLWSLTHTYSFRNDLFALSFIELKRMLVGLPRLVLSLHTNFIIQNDDQISKNRQFSGKLILIEYVYSFQDFFFQTKYFMTRLRWVESWAWNLFWSDRIGLSWNHRCYKQSLKKIQTNFRHLWTISMTETPF